MVTSYAAIPVPRHDAHRRDDEQHLNAGNFVTRVGEGLDTKKEAVDSRAETSLVRSTLHGASVNVLAVSKDGQRGELMLAGTTITPPARLPWRPTIWSWPHRPPRSTRAARARAAT
ncbi:MAG: hypothetical protein ACRYGA_13060 [Janthinobacterium lividum]